MTKKNTRDLPAMRDAQGRLTKRERWSRIALAGLGAITVSGFGIYETETNSGPSGLTVEEQETHKLIVASGVSHEEAIRDIIAMRPTPEQRFQQRRRDQEAADLQAAACKITGCL